MTTKAGSGSTFGATKTEGAIQGGKEVIFIAIKDLSQGIIGAALDDTMTGPVYMRGFAPRRHTDGI